MNGAPLCEAAGVPDREVSGASPARALDGRGAIRSGWARPRRMTISVTRGAMYRRVMTDAVKRCYSQPGCNVSAAHARRPGWVAVIASRDWPSGDVLQQQQRLDYS